MDVDPNLVAQAYKQMLTDSQGQVALLNAACNQLQNQIASLEEQVKELKAANERLMNNSGREDGVPRQWESETVG